MSNEKITELERKLEALQSRQFAFQQEINQLKMELNSLKTEETKSSVVVTPQTPEVTQKISAPTPQKSTLPNIPNFTKPNQLSDLEKIIGESWINKIGILILIIGVAIGAKYSIENELISPLTRIILGYATGIGLLGFGIKLKPKFESYSAVLVSGAMAIFYFITYFAYDFYQLIPQVLAFAMMLIFTAFTVFAAIKYNRTAIAHIGLVGAYAVPFLLSSGSGRVDILFSYIAVINAGILFISIKKDWKSLYYSAFAFSWLIYGAWFFDKFLFYTDGEYRLLALGFATLFFLMFYAISIFNRIISKENLDKLNLVLILLNSFIYFGLGYGIFDREQVLESYLGLFTLFNAIIHFAAAYILRYQRLTNSNIFYIALGLVFTFITIAIPIQLDGNWVTLLWIAQGTVLFWLGKTKKISIYEKISIPILFLAFFSLIHDWIYRPAEIPFLNITFLTGLLAIAGYSFAIYLSLKHPEPTEEKFNIFKTIRLYSIPFLLIIVSYLTFDNEIRLYFNNWSENSRIKTLDFYEYNHHIYTLKSIYSLAYSLIFFGGMSLLNFYKFKNKTLTITALVVGMCFLLFTQTTGVFLLGELRSAYIERNSNEFFDIGFGYISVRYLLWASVGFYLWVAFKDFTQIFQNTKYQLFTEAIIYLSLLGFLSNELITWLDIAGYQDIFKLGLSILWGAYSLVLIYFGIFKRKKHLRIFAIVLFAGTLAKLFLYDIADLSTISKTIVLIILGVLLLLISFLYNRFKDKINDENSGI